MSKMGDGLKSEALLAALQEALRGSSTRLEDLLARHGGYGRPNLKLAEAFGAEVATLPGTLAPLLERLGADDAAPDQARVFLPVAAAHGWTHRLRAGREVEAAWSALVALAADERGPVRVGVLDALVTYATREGSADPLIARAREWLSVEDRELRFGAAALVIEALTESKLLSVVRDHEALLAYLTEAIDTVADAPRSAERSDARRRVLTSLSLGLASVVATVRSGEIGLLWFEAEATRAKHPDIRKALSAALIKLANVPQAPAAHRIEELRQKLEDSAKPLRDPTLKRPGTGRGRRSRNTR
jgi:hypothetical protein